MVIIWNINQTVGTRSVWFSAPIAQFYVSGSAIKWFPFDFRPKWNTNIEFGPMLHWSAAHTHTHTPSIFSAKFAVENDQYQKFPFEIFIIIIFSHSPSVNEEFDVWYACAVVSCSFRELHLMTSPTENVSLVRWRAGDSMNNWRKH